MPPNKRPTQFSKCIKIYNRDPQFLALRVVLISKNKSLGRSFQVPPFHIFKNLYKIYIISYSDLNSISTKPKERNLNTEMLVTRPTMFENSNLVFQTN